LKDYEKVIRADELSMPRKFISKTSEARKHHPKKPIEIALPEIYASLGNTFGRARNHNIYLALKMQPCSQMEPRRNRNRIDMFHESQQG
jgi:hypothetical protein